MRLLFVDKHGNRITPADHANLYMDNKYRIIGYDILHDGSKLFTTWIGIDVWCDGEMFETAHISVERDVRILDRYKSMDKAKEMHIYYLNKLEHSLGHLEGI